MNEIKFLKTLVSIFLVLLISAAVWILTSKSATQALALEHYGQVPDFVLTSQLKKTFDSKELKGKVWVASFVYTSCKESCPMLAAQMKRLSASMPASDGFRLVSISVDPEKDTPERLVSYAKGLGVTDPRWIFLTGKITQIRSIVFNGFKLTNARATDRAAGDSASGYSAAQNEASVLHSSKLVLVDKQGSIRGYYDGLLGESAVLIKRAAEQLLAQP